MCNRFDRIPACDRQTDRQTDGSLNILRRHSLAAQCVSRGKKRDVVSGTANLSPRPLHGGATW